MDPTGPVLLLLQWPGPPLVQASHPNVRLSVRRRSLWGLACPLRRRGREAGGKGAQPAWCEHGALPCQPLKRGTHLLLVNEVQVEVRAEEAWIGVLFHEPEDALLRQIEAAMGDTLQVVLGVLPCVGVQVDLWGQRAVWSGPLARG